MIDIDVNKLDYVSIVLNTTLMIGRGIPNSVFCDEDDTPNLSKASEDEVYGAVFADVIAKDIATKIIGRSGDVYLHNMTDAITNRLAEITETGK